MSTLTDLLDQYFFADAPGSQTRMAIRQAWNQTTNSPWSELYAASLADALADELPHLAAYSGQDTSLPDHAAIQLVLDSDLGESGNTLLSLDTTTGTFLTELARTLQARRALIINGQNPFTDEYREILLNLFDNAHTRFKASVSANEATFSSAIAGATGHDPLLNNAIASFLDRQFAIELSSLGYARVRSSAESPTAGSSVEPAPLAPSAPTLHPDFGSDQAPAAPTPPPPPPMPPIPRQVQNQLRVLIATPADVLDDRTVLEHVVAELDTRFRSRYNIELKLVNPPSAHDAGNQSLVEIADIFLGVLWLHFGQATVETNATGGAFFAGTEHDFSAALKQHSASSAALPRTVIYRSIRPPVDLLRFNVTDYAQVQRFFEEQTAQQGDDWVHVYANSDELANDARARLEAWCANYAEELAAALTDYGKQFAARGQIAAALGALQQTVGLYHELEQPSAELDAWLQVGTLQRAAGDNAAAQTAFQSALDLARQTGSTDAAGESWYQLGLIAADNDEWRAAIHSFDQARALYTPDQPLYRTILAAETNAYEFLGDSERATNELVQARDAYRDALALADETDDHPRMSQLWSKLGALAAQTREWDQAADAYDKALTIGGVALAEPTRRALSDAQAEAHTHLAAQARASGDSAAATASYHQALTSLGQGSDDRLKKATLLGALGALAAERGDWHESTRAYDQALANLDRPEDQAQRNELLDAEANAYFRLGESLEPEQRWDEAGAAYRDSLALSQELDDRAQQGITLYRLGSVSHAQGRLQEANAYFTQSLTRLDRPDSAELRNEVLENQAQVLEEVGDQARDAEQWAQAEVSYVQARGVREQLNQGSKTGNLLTNLGIVLAAQGRGQEAIAYFDGALDHLQGAEDAQARSQVMRFQADTLAKLADTRRGAGDPTQAEAAYRQALDLAQQLDDDSLQAELLDQLGLVAADQERWDDAVNFYDQALAHLTDADAAETRADVERHQLGAFSSLGARERTAKQYPQAEMAYRSALTLAQQLDDQEHEADLLHTLGVLAIEQENWDEALVNLRRSLGIYNLMPSAPAQPRVIFDIGRAQRGHKRRAMLDAVAQGETAFAAGDTAQASQAYTDALAAARDLGENKVQVNSLIRLGDLARSNEDWDNALASYDQALEGLGEPDDLAQRNELYRSQIDALEHRSERARTRRDWMSASADLEQALALAGTLDDSNRQGELTFRRGEIAADQSEWQTAIALYSEALEAYDVTDEQRANIERAQADAFKHMGDAERAAQNWVGADAAYSQSLTLYQNLGDHTSQALLLTALASVASPQERWSDAVEYLGRAHTLALQEPADSTALDAAQIESELAHATQALKREQQASAEARGDTLRASQDWQGADAAYRQAIGFAEELQDRTARAELTAKLGFVASESGALDRALEHYREAAGLSDTPDQTSQRGALIELQAQTLQELGNRAGAAGDWEKALRAYQDSVALLDAPEQTAQRADVVRLEGVTLQNLGDSARSVENWSQALDYYRRSAGLYATLPDPERLKQTRLLQAEALVNLARGARANKQFPTSLGQYEQAAALYADANATQALDLLQGERILALTEAGEAAADAEQWSAAETSFQEGLALAQEKGDRFAHADLLYRLGDVEQRRGQLQPALGYYAQAHELAAPADMPELRGKLLLAEQSAAHKLGDEQRIAGDLDAAERSYERALEMAQERNDPAEAGQLYFLLGTLAADRSQWERAVTAYDSALARFDLAGDTEHQRDVKSYQAFAFQQLGDTQGKTDAAEKSLHSALALANDIGDDQRAGQALYRLGLLAFARGAWRESVDFSDAAAAKLPANTDAETLALAREQSEVSTRALKREELGQAREHAAQAAANQQWEDAASAYRRAESLAGELGDEVSAAQAHQSLVALYAAEAKSLEANSSWDQAANAYRTSLDLAQQANDAATVQARQADLLALRASESQAAIGAQDWAHARGAAQARVALAQEFRNPLAHADALSALGALLLSRREWDSARDALAQAVPIYTEHEASAPLLQARQDLERAEDALNRRAEQEAAMTRGAHAADAKEWAEANAAYRQALGLAQSLEDEQGVAAASRALVELGHTRAQTLADAQNWDDAAPAYRDAIAVADEFAATDAKQARQTDLIALAVAETAAHARAGDDAREEQAIRKQLALAQEFNQPQAQADAFLALGSWNASHSQFEAARDSFSSATELYTQLARMDAQAQSSRELSRVQDILERRAKEGQALTRASQAAAAQQWDTAYASYREALDLEASLDDHAAIRARQQDLVDLAATQTAAYRTARDWQNAEQAAQTRLKLAQEFNQPAEQAAALAALADIYAEQGKSELADETFSEAAVHYQELGDGAADAEQLDDALRAYQHAADLAERGHAPHHRAEILFSAGLVHAARADHRAAAQSYSAAYDIVADYELPEQQSEILEELGNAQTALGELDSARATYRRAVVAADKAQALARSGQLEATLGDLSFRQERWQETVTHYDAAVRKLHEAAPEVDLVPLLDKQGAAYEQLGGLYFGEGSWHQAREAYAHALDSDLKAGRTDRDGEVLYRLGLTAAAQSDWADAANYYSSSLASLTGDELAQCDRTLAQLAYALQQEGKRAQAAGEWDVADSAYARAITMAGASVHFDQLTDLWLRRGEVYGAQGRWGAALGAFQSAAEYDHRYGADARKDEIETKRAEALIREGHTALDAGDTELAYSSFQHGVSAAAQLRQPSLTGQAIEGMGRLSAEQGDWSAALDAYAQAGHQFASVEDTEHWRGVAVREAALLRQVGADFEDRGQEADAERAYHRALALGQTADHHADDGELYFALARTLAAQQRWDDAALAAVQADALYQPLSSRARAEFEQTQTTIFENAGALAQSNQQWADAEEYFKHAADLHDKLDNRPAAGLAWQHLGEIAVAQENWHKAARYNTEALARLDTPESAQARGQVMALQARILSGIGTEQRQAGDWDGAVETYHSAIVIAREQGDLDTLAQVYGMLGSVHEGRSEWADAAREYKNALDIYQELDRPADQASAWQQIGDVERKTEQYDAAAEAFANARALYHEAGDAPGEGMVIHRLGLVQGDKGNWDAALTWYDDALAHFNEHGLASAKPQVYRSVEQAVRGAKRLAAQSAAERGDRSSDAGDWGAAESSYRESLDLYQELGDATELAQAHAKLGSSFEAQEQLDQAFTEYKASLAHANTTDSRDLQIAALVAIGNVQRARANWHESESEYRQALALDPEHSDPQRTAALYDSLGELRGAQDDWEGALGYFHQALALLGPDEQEARARIERNVARAQQGAHQKTQADTRHALELARENGDLAEQGELLNTLGLMSAEDKNWSEALDYYQEAIRVFEELARQDDEQEIWRTAQGTVLNNIGEAQQNLGAWSDAEVFYNRALHVAREVGDNESEAALLASLGLTAEHQAELPRALDLDMQALAKFRELGGETPPPELLERIGNLQLELERLDAADNTFHEALAAATAADQPDRMARLLKQMGLLAEGRDETDTALACYDRALALYVDLSEPTEQKQLLKRQSDLYLASEQWAPAEETARQALTLAQAEDDRPLAAELTARLGNLAQRSGDWDSAVTHYNDALALHEPQAARARAGLHTSLGEVHLSRGAPDAARGEYQAALALVGDDADSSVELWTKLAELEEGQNRWAEAGSAYDAAAQALGATAPVPPRLDLLIRRGDAALQAEDWSAAETAYDASLQLAQRSSNRTFEGWILNKLGLLAQAQHQWGESLQTFQESIETLRETGEAVAEAHVLNNIARLKLETGEGTEGDLFAQAALTIAKNFGSAEEQSRALYQRGLVALETQDLEVAERYFRQAIVADPQNWTAQLQLGNVLIAGGQVEPSAQQAEAGLGQNPEWALGAQAQMAVAALFQENTKEFRQQLKRTRALLEQDREHAALAVGFVDAVSWLVRALEGDTDAALGGMQAMTLAPGLPARLDAYRFLRGALYALARTPRRLRNKSALVAYFAPPNAPARPRSKRRPASGHDAQSELFTDEPSDEPHDAPAAPDDDDTEAHDSSAGA